MDVRADGSPSRCSRSCGACTSTPPTIGTVADDRPAGRPTDVTVPLDLTVTAGKPFPPERCAANEAAGTITFLTGFDFAAAASMIDVFVARSRGYYAAMCLDVAIEPSFSADNYPLVAADTAQFASGGSFGELVDYAGRNEAQFKALAVEGRQDIATLIVKPDEGTDARGPARQDDRREDGAAPVGRGDAAAARPAARHGLRHRRARRVRSEGAHRHARHRRLRRLPEQRAAAAATPPTSTSASSTRPTSTCPAASA